MHNYEALLGGKATREVRPSRHLLQSPPAWTKNVEDDAETKFHDMFVTLCGATRYTGARYVHDMQYVDDTLARSDPCKKPNEWDAGKSLRLDLLGLGFTPGVGNFVTRSIPSLATRNPTSESKQQRSEGFHCVAYQKAPRLGRSFQEGWGKEGTGTIRPVNEGTLEIPHTIGSQEENGSARDEKAGRRT
jgi:hypothetical protein